ncbi:hypothetical protein ISCGN_029186 [Ixodes scapularis]
MDKTRLALVLMGAGLVVAVIVIIILSVVLVEPSPKFLSEKPHPSGSERDGVDIVNFLENSLRESGFDEVKKVPYLLVHPLPDPEHPNSAELIFVNYGRYEDFDKLETLGISVAGFICLARYGMGTRVEKVRICEERGGIGAILFGDPMDMAPKGENFVFPKSLYVGGSAMQRGSLDFSQDSETPGYPSIPEAVRVADPPGLPKIPAQVIGYDDARVLLKLLGGPDWAVKGGFNFTYRTGPFASSHKGEKVRLSVNNIIKRLVVHDVIGIIRGSVEPGQFSVTGNHHDAWGFGASDPSSATAALLEASRTLGAMVKRGWRPRRSIVVAFWAQEEVGRAGSREWVEKVDGVSLAPYYHTAYETLELYQRFVDPDYAIMERCSQLVGALTLSLAEAELLPYNMVDLGQALQEGFGDLQTHLEDFAAHNVSADWLKKEIELFVQEADSWHKWISDRKSFDLGTLRFVNERMMLVERAFIKPDGLMGDPTIRHVALGASMEDSYKSVIFAMLRLQLYYVSRMKPDSKEAAQAWFDIARHVNDIALAVRSARMMMDPNRAV